MVRSILMILGWVTIGSNVIPCLAHPYQCVSYDYWGIAEDGEAHGYCAVNLNLSCDNSAAVVVPADGSVDWDIGPVCDDIESDLESYTGYPQCGNYWCEPTELDDNSLCIGFHGEITFDECSTALDAYREECCEITFWDWDAVWDCWEYCECWYVNDFIDEVDCESGICLGSGTIYAQFDDGRVLDYPLDNVPGYFPCSYEEDEICDIFIEEFYSDPYTIDCDLEHINGWIEDDSAYAAGADMSIELHSTFGDTQCVFGYDSTDIYGSADWMLDTSTACQQANQCLTPIQVCPYDQSFEDPSFPPCPWTGSGWYRNSRHQYYGNYCAACNVDTVGDDTRRLMAPLNFSGKSCTNMSFYYKVSKTDVNHRVLRLLGWTAADGWFVLTDWVDITNTTSWTYFSAGQNLWKFTNKQEVFIKLQTKRLFGSTSRTLYVDDFHISCEPYFSPTPTFTLTPTVRPTLTPTLTPTVMPTLTPTPSMTLTPTLTPTPTWTPPTLPAGYLAISDGTGGLGEQVVFTIQINSYESIIEALQFDLRYDSSVLVYQDENFIAGQDIQDWYVGDNIIEDGHLRFAAVSNQAEPIQPGSEKHLVSFVFTANACSSESPFLLDLCNLDGDIHYFENWDGSYYCSCLGIMGDIDNDLSISVLDAQTAFSITLGSYDPTPEEHCRADVNRDGRVSTTDVLCIFRQVIGYPNECFSPDDSESVASENPGKLRIIVTPSTSSDHDMYQVTIELAESVRNLDNFQFDLEFDDTRLTLLSMKPGLLVHDWTMLDYYERAPGLLTVAGINAEISSDQPRQGDLVTFMFRSLQHSINPGKWGHILKINN